MKRMDARTLNRQQLSEKRQQVIALYQSGMAIKAIMRETGLCRQTVDRAIQRHHAGDTQTPDARGNKKGSGQLLSEDFQSRICDEVFSRRPWQLGIDLRHYVWTRDTVQTLILKRCGIDVSNRVMRNYLQRWGITPDTKKPRLERCTPTIRIWLMAHYPVVEAQAQSEGAKILWLSQHTAITHPFRTDEQKRNKHILMGVVDHRDALSWLIMSGIADANNQIRWLEALMKEYPKQKLFLIRHDEILFKTDEVNDWLQKHQDRIVLVPDLKNRPPASPASPGNSAEVL